MLTVLGVVTVVIVTVLGVVVLLHGSSRKMGNPEGARVQRLALVSRAVGATEHVTVVVPGGATPRRHRPLLVFLHGRGADDRTYLETPMFAELRRLGPEAPVIAFPNGGDHSYWHDRADGAWGRYVTSEVIPTVEHRFHTDPRRIAIGGISMGGFGALDLATRAPGRYCAVGAHSPAIWQTASATAPGAFDSAADFAAHDLVRTARSDPNAFIAQPLRIDAGADDPFLTGDRALVAALRAHGIPATVHVAPGGHDDAYWSSQWSHYLAFYARALRTCLR